MKVGFVDIFFIDFIVWEHKTDWVIHVILIRKWDRLSFLSFTTGRGFPMTMTGDWGSASWAIAARIPDDPSLPGLPCRFAYCITLWYNQGFAYYIMQSVYYTLHQFAYCKFFDFTNPSKNAKKRMEFCDELWAAIESRLLAPWRTGFASRIQRMPSRWLKIPQV